MPLSLDPKPLPFEPASIAGLSEKLVVSHHRNNYGGAARRLRAIEEEFAGGAASMPAFRLNGLKREQLIALNSVALHEIYFAGFAGAERPGKGLADRIDRDFGSFDSWRSEFAAMGKALAGGSGWVLLVWSQRLGRLFNSWAADHSMTPANGTILIALDMYEHAYAIDYGADAGAYVDVFMRALRWSRAEREFANAAA